MIRVVPFIPEHLDDILSGELNSDKNRPMKIIGEVSSSLVVPEMSFSAIANGHLIGSCGIIPFWHGVGEAWVCATNRISDHPVDIARMIKLGFKDLRDEKELHRVQGMMRTDWPELKKWADFLEMKFEGTMKKFGSDGEDYNRYAWVKE